MEQSKFTLLDVLSEIADKYYEEGTPLELGFITTGENHILKRDTIHICADHISGVDDARNVEISIHYENLLAIEGLYPDVYFDDEGHPFLDHIPVVHYRKLAGLPLLFVEDHIEGECIDDEYFKNLYL